MNAERQTHTPVGRVSPQGVTRQESGADADVGLRCANPTYQAGATGNIKETPKKHQRNTKENLLSILREQPSLSVKALAELTGSTVASIQHHLRMLKGAGRIRHVGPTKSGYWEILDAAPDEGAGV